MLVIFKVALRVERISDAPPKVAPALNVAAPASDISKVKAVITEPASSPLKIMSLSCTSDLIKKSDEELMGRNSQSHVVVFPRGKYNPGDYVKVKITECTRATLKGIVVE